MIGRGTFTIVSMWSNQTCGTCTPENSKKTFQANALQKNDKVLLARTKEIFIKSYANKQLLNTRFENENRNL